MSTATTETKPDTLQGHPLAQLFPPVEGLLFDELVADIKANGLREPITLFEGRILDGLTRYRACVAAEVEPHFEDFTGPSAVEFVISKNLHRRHLSPDQRAVLALELVPHLEEEAKQRQREHGQTAPGRKAVRDKSSPTVSKENRKAVTQAAKKVGAPIQRTKKLKRIRKEANRLYREVEAGKKTIAEANRELTKLKGQRNRPVARPATPAPDNGQHATEGSTEATGEVPAESPAAPDSKAAYNALSRLLYQAQTVAALLDNGTASSIWEQATESERDDMASQLDALTSLCYLLLDARPK